METLRCPRTLADVEREYILDALVCCHGNRTRTATLLNISIRCLRTKLHEYAHAGCAVCDPHGHLDHNDCNGSKSPATSGHRH